MTDGKWVYEHSDPDFWGCEYEFDTKQEAIEAARESAPQYAEENFAGNDGGEYLESGHFDVGQLRRATFSIDGEDIIEDIREQFSDQCGEAADDWLRMPNPYQGSEGQRQRAVERREKFRQRVEELGERLTAVVETWLEDIGETPRFYSVENIDTISVKPE